MVKSLLDLFRRGTSGRLVSLKPGPLTPGERSGSAIPHKLRRKRQDPPTDIDRRAILADQIGVLPDILAPLRPRFSASHQFTIAEAQAYARELGVNIFHLIDAGANIAGLSRRELAEFVAEVTESRNAFITDDLLEKDHSGENEISTEGRKRPQSKNNIDHNSFFDDVFDIPKGTESPFF